MSEQITPHFQRHELECRCCGKMPRQGFINMLEALRVKCDFPFHMSSVARCETHNQNIGGAKHSDHIVRVVMEDAAFLGAADIKLDKWQYEKRWDLVMNARDMGFDVIEVCDWHIHVGKRGITKPLLIWGQSK